jgi:predicted transcriptional regulator
MPISLRLPTEIEDQIAGFSARQGMSKSAVIVRSIREFLDRNAQPSSFQIYEAVMAAGAAGADTSGDAQQDAKREAVEKRPHKILLRDAVRQKHAMRSAGAAELHTPHTPHTPQKPHKAQ